MRWLPILLLLPLAGCADALDPDCRAVAGAEPGPTLELIPFWQQTGDELAQAWARALGTEITRSHGSDAFRSTWSTPEGTIGLIQMPSTPPMLQYETHAAWTDWAGESMEADLNRLAAALGFATGVPDEGSHAWEGGHSQYLDLQWHVDGMPVDRSLSLTILRQGDDVQMLSFEEIRTGDVEVLSDADVLAAAAALLRCAGERTTSPPTLDDPAWMDGEGRLWRAVEAVVEAPCGPSQVRFSIDAVTGFSHAQFGDHCTA